MASRTELIYCPVCGYLLGTRQEGGRLRQACDNCGYVHYVNPVPAVGIVIEMEGGIVLIRRGNPPHQGRWALPSGYIESDESAEEAAVREAEEETGLKVEIIELAGVNSFPEGPPLSGIMIFFRARPVGGTLQAGDDAAEVRVFQPDEVPLLPFRTHREMMAQWLSQNAPSRAPADAPITNVNVEAARVDRATDAATALEQSVGGDDLSLPLLEFQPPDAMLSAIDAQKDKVWDDDPDNVDSDFFIRLAAPEDAQEVMALLHLIPANRGFTREEWRAAYDRFQAGGVDVFVAVSHKTPPMILGFIALSVVRSLTEQRGLVNDMAVLPTYRRRGVGAALLEAVMRHAQTLDIHTLIVNAERASESARIFWAACGFAQSNLMQIKLR